MSAADTADVGRQFGDLATQTLITMAGLPGAGKSTIAEILSGRLGAPIVSVDPIESAILSAGIDAEQPTGLAAYLVAEAMAETALSSGRSVIVDAVNAVEPARLQWRNLAERSGVRLRVVEVVCSDADVHRERLEKRVRNLPGMAELTWRSVEQRIDEYDGWSGESALMPRITLDSMGKLGENVDAALAFLAE